MAKNQARSIVKRVLALAAVLVIASAGVVQAEEPTAGAWIGKSGGLVAHALGAVPGTTEKQLYARADCREAMEYSYAQGFRVFEADLNLTTDNNLACVHDWAGYSGVKSTAEWQAQVMDGKYHTLMLDDVLTYMSKHPDMYIITDTKSFDYTAGDIRQQFDLIYTKALAHGVLDRVIPQFYSQEMYEEICEVYAWPSLIYTLYASTDTDAQVSQFVAKHDNVQAVTMAASRFSQNFGTALTSIGKYIYLFTLNTESDISYYRERGVTGFYTDFVMPVSEQDFRIFPCTSIHEIGVFICAKMSGGYKGGRTHCE